MYLRPWYDNSVGGVDIDAVDRRGNEETEVFDRLAMINHDDDDDEGY